MLEGFFFLLSELSAFFSLASSLSSSTFFCFSSFFFFPAALICFRNRFRFDDRRSMRSGSLLFHSLSPFCSMFGELEFFLLLPSNAFVLFCRRRKVKQNPFFRFVSFSFPPLSHFLFLCQRPMLLLFFHYKRKLVKGNKEKKKNKN